MLSDEEDNIVPKPTIFKACKISANLFKLIDNNKIFPNGLTFCSLKKHKKVLKYNTTGKQYEISVFQVCILVQCLILLDSFFCFASTKLLFCYIE